MNTPLLPETPFTPLPESRLEAMIAHAVAQPQLPRTARVIAFRRPWTATAGLAAMAASIMLALMATPQQYNLGNLTQTADDATLSADVSDLLLLDSLGA